MFHYLFPIGTMGLAPFIAFYTYKGTLKNDPVALAAARFYARIFSVNFAIGVVTGIPMEFQFGTNWAAFSSRAGSIAGQTLSMESVFAFFLESIFLGVFLYGRTRVSAKMYCVSAFALWAGAWLSGFFIVATDAWMQNPVGYAIGPDKTIMLTSIWAVLLSPFAWWQYAHVMTGALLAGAFVVAGVASYYLLAGRETLFATRTLRSGIITVFAASLLAVFPTGDRNSSDVTHAQPAKLAAMEGLFAGTRGAPLAIIGIPDTRNKVLIDPVYAPDLLSFLAYGNVRANVTGLDGYRSDLLPPVEVTYYAYHVMVGLGTIFVAGSALAVLLLFRRRLERARWMLWIIMLGMPFPYIANEAGWVVTEVGRQPWIVYGLMRTAEGASPTVAAGETIFTTIGFSGMYFLLGVIFLLLTLRRIAEGPQAA